MSRENNLKNPFSGNIYTHIDVGIPRILVRTYTHRCIRIPNTQKKKRTHLPQNCNSQTLASHTHTAWFLLHFKLHTNYMYKCNGCNLFYKKKQKKNHTLTLTYCITFKTNNMHIHTYIYII